ncbi:MAG: glycosyltransferase [Patescibacteria group bacterium]
MTSKNILIVTHYFLPHVGGIEMVAYNQAKGLVANGHSVTLVTSRVGSTKVEEVIDGIKVVRLASFNFFEKFGIPFPVPYPAGWVTLWSLVRYADIVHVHDAFYANSFIAAAAARFSRKVLMMTQHVALIAYPSKLVQIIQKFVYATTGAIVFSFSQYICVCNDRVRNFLEARGILEHKIKFLPNGVDNKLFNSGTPHQKIELRRKFNIPEIGKVLLFVGRFVPKKGFDKVLAAQSSDYHIVCVGGKTPSGDFPNISFMGEVDQFVLADLYKAADIFILPSESEGFPLSIQEAMSSGLPIITTWDPGYQVYGLDKNNICFIESTETSLKEAIRRIYLDDAALRKMSSYSQEYAAKYFSWSRNVSALEVVYEQILSSPKLKIALVSDAVYPFSKGGKEKRLFGIATRLVKEGYDVTIYCMQWWRGSKTIEKDGIRYYAISPYYPLYVGSRRSIKQGILFALHCLKLLFRKFDVVDVDHIPHFVIFTMKLVCVLRRKKMIATWHEVWGGGILEILPWKREGTYCVFG